MKSVLLLGGMVSEAVPPSIPSMTGLPLFRSKANSSAAVLILTADFNLVLVVVF